MTVGVVAFAGTVKIEFNQTTLNNTSTAYVTTAWDFTVGGFKFNINQANPNTGQIKVNQNAGSGFMLYNETALPGNVESIKIVFTTADNAAKNPSLLTLTTGSAAITTAQTASSSGISPVWTASSLTATWTIEGGGKFFRFDSNRNVGGTNKVDYIEITYAEGTSNQSATPSFEGFASGKGTWWAATNVKINAAEGAQVFYTTDETDPTEASTAYTAAGIDVPAAVTEGETFTIKAVALESGKTLSNVATLTLTAEQIFAFTQTTRVAAGTEFILIGSKNSKTYMGLAFAASKTGGYMSSSEVTPENNSLSLNQANAFVLEAAADGNFYIKQKADGRYLYLGGSNLSAFQVGTLDASDNAFEWAFTANADGTFKIANVGKEGYELRFGDGTYTSFSNLNNGNGSAPYIYAKEGSVALLAADLKFDAATAEATMGQAFTAPGFTKATTAEVTFTSSTPATATVDAATGAVTLVAPGTTTIMATSPANDEYEAGTAQYVLTVNPEQGVDPDPEQPKPAGLAFSATTAEATIGETFTAPVLVKATTAAVTYSSSNNKVAVIDGGSGKIVLLAEGSTIITASAPATTGFLAGTAQYTLNVKAAQTTPEPIERKVPVMYFTPGVVQAEMGKAVTEPVLTKDTDAEVFYTSNNTDVATVDALTGKLTLVAAGNAMITATAPATANYLNGEAFYMLSVTGDNGGGDDPNPPTPPTPGASYVVFDITDAGTWTAQGTGFTRTNTVDGHSFTITTDQASSTSTLVSPANDTFSWRVYKSSNFTLSAADVTMSKIIITFDDYSSSKYVSTMTLSDGWTGSLDGVTYTITGSGKTITATASEKQVRIKKIVVETGEGGGDDPNPPTPGTDYASLADFMNAKPADNATLNADLTAVYQNGKDLFVTSNGAYAMVYGELTATYNNGDVIKAPVQGKYDEYNGVPEFIPVASTFAAGQAGTPVAAQAVEISALTTADFGKYVRLEGVTIEASADNDRSFTATDGTSTVTVWNRWSKSVSVATGTNATVYGFIGINKPADSDAVVNIWPVRVEVEGGDDPNPPTPGTGTYVVFDIENPGTWTAQGTGFTRTNTVDGHSFTITTDQASSSTALISPDANSYAWRVYKGSNFTLSAADVTMSKIIITYDDYTTDGKGYAFEMTLSNGWTGSLEGVTYTITGSGNTITAAADLNQVRIKKIVVETGNGGGDDPNPPAPSSETVTFDFTQPATLTPAQDMPADGAPVIINGVTFTAGPVSCMTENTGTTESRDPRLYLYKGACEFRFYEEDVTTISASAGLIEKIEFISSYPSNFDQSTADCGTFTNAVWTGEAATVKFSWHKSSGDYSPKTNQIKVTYKKSDDINAIDAEETDAPVEFYTLQGVRISNPAAGQIVIRRQGTRVSKILVK